MKVYDHHFNWNEWYIITGLVIGISIVLFLPKRFSKQLSLVYFTCGIYSGFFFDHSLSVIPVSFYDVNDKSSYQFFDFLSYLSYGPVSYLFFYCYDRFRPSSPLFYILIWTLISIGLEWVANRAGVFHYRHGYQLAYSFEIYLVVHSVWLFLYNRLQKQEKALI